MRDPLHVANDILADPSVERILEALKEVMNDGRRHGEGWAEIAIARWLREQALDQQNEAVQLALNMAAEEVETKGWRRPEFQSSHDLEAAAKASER